MMVSRAAEAPTAHDNWAPQARLCWLKAGCEHLRTTSCHQVGSQETGRSSWLQGPFLWMSVCQHQHQLLWCPHVPRPFAVRGTHRLELLGRELRPCAA